MHSNERPFPCHYCDQTFKSSSNRSKHERRIHSKERNAMKTATAEQQLNKLAEKTKIALPTLPTPPKIKKDPLPPVAASNLLNSSLSTADGEERVFRCDHEGCFSSFKTRSSLRDHQKGKTKLSDRLQALNRTFPLSVHSDERPYPCAFCSSAFKSSSNRSKHERGSHPEQYQKRKLNRESQRNGEADKSPPPKRIRLASVQQSPKVIKQESTASPKKQTNEYPCRYCDRVLTRADNRDKHEATHKDNRAFGRNLEHPTLSQSQSLLLSFRLWILFEELQDARCASVAYKDPHGACQTVLLSPWLR